MKANKETFVLALNRFNELNKKTRNKIMIFSPSLKNTNNRITTRTHQDNNNNNNNNLVINKKRFKRP